MERLFACGWLMDILSPNSRTVLHKLHITFFLKEHKVLNKHWLMLSHIFPGDKHEIVNPN